MPECVKKDGIQALSRRMIKGLLLTGLLLFGQTQCSAEPSWDLLDEDCSDITDWTDGDAGNGVSEVSPAGQFHLYISPAASGSYAYQTRDFGSFPTTYTVEIKVYHDVLGTVANTDYAQFEFHKDDLRFQFRLASDGLFVHDGAAWNEVGTNLVQTGVWQTWRFLITGTTPLSATVDVYLNGVLQISGVDCSNTGTFTDGRVDVLQFGYTVAAENHTDWIKIATGLYPPDLRRIIFIQ